MNRKGLTNAQVIIAVALLANITAVSLATHRFFKEKMGRMTCDSNMENIMEALQIYYAYHNPKENTVREAKIGPVNIEFLARKDFLLYIPLCPQGGIYKWDSEGELYCTYHGLGEAVSR